MRNTGRRRKGEGEGEGEREETARRSFEEPV
jgi:hypothetical protein